jgi:hypothetical protein
MIINAVRPAAEFRIEAGMTALPLQTIASTTPGTPFTAM